MSWPAEIDVFLAIGELSRERSLILCFAMMRAAALDLNEQGDAPQMVTSTRRTTHIATHPRYPDLGRVHR